MKTTSHLLESKHRDDKNSHLEAFAHAADAMTRQEGLPPEIMDSFVEHYVELYEQNYLSRVGFMEEWGYGLGVPQFKTAKDINHPIEIVAHFSTWMAGYAVGVTLLFPLISVLAIPVGWIVGRKTEKMAKRLLSRAKKKDANAYNERITNTPGYEQMVLFHEGFDQLIDETVGDPSMIKIFSMYLENTYA